MAFKRYLNTIKRTFKWLYNGVKTSRARLLCKRAQTRKEYEAFDNNKWHKEYYDSRSGGYVVVDKQRYERRKISNNCRDIYRKEVAMAEVFADNGHQMVMLNEVSGVSSPDVLIDGMKAELKSTQGTGNIIKYAKKAVQKQGAEIVLFEFGKMDAKVKRYLRELAEKENIHGLYFVADEKEVLPF